MATARQHIQPEPEAEPTPPPGPTTRTLFVALVCIIGTVLFIHWAELVLGGERGHSALANTSIPVGAFFALVVVLACNALIGAVAPRAHLSRRELVIVYVLTASASVIVSSGGIHFLVPTLTAPWYFATPENNGPSSSRTYPSGSLPGPKRSSRPSTMGNRPSRGEAGAPRWAVGLASWSSSRWRP